MLSLRSESPADRAAIHRVNREAFGRPQEADLVDALRKAGALKVSLVAVDEREIVGHIAFSPVTVAGAAETDVKAFGLGPMAVSPRRQRQGIGRRLVEAGLDAVAQRGIGLVFVLGHPEYYPRFGFRPAPPRGLVWERDLPEEVFMVIELAPGALEGVAGIVRYSPEFSRF